jgi:hypothetical protein
MCRRLPHLAVNASATEATNNAATIAHSNAPLPRSGSTPKTSSIHSRLTKVNIATSRRDCESSLQPKSNACTNQFHPHAASLRLSALTDAIRNTCSYFREHQYCLRSYARGCHATQQRLRSHDWRPNARCPSPGGRPRTPQSPWDATEPTLETADAATVSDELFTIPAVVALARRARRVVIANLALGNRLGGVLDAGHPRPKVSYTSRASLKLATIIGSVSVYQLVSSGRYCSPIRRASSGSWSATDRA